jgi:hypothetical protein
MRRRGFLTAFAVAIDSPTGCDSLRGALIHCGERDADRLHRLLKAGGYKVVHTVARQPLTTLSKYDDMVRQQDKLSVTNIRPETSVVHTIGE